MFATGRKPSSQDLGLEEVGVKTEPKSGKAITVDPHVVTFGCCSLHIIGPR